MKLIEESESAMMIFNHYRQPIPKFQDVSNKKL